MLREPADNMLNSHASGRTDVLAWLRGNWKIVLLGFNALLAGVLLFAVLSWVVFKARTASLLSLADRIEAASQQEKTSDRERTLAAGRAGLRLPLIRAASANDASATSPSLGLSGDGATSDALRSAEAVAAGREFWPEPPDEKTRDMLARLERRSLFGEPRPSVRFPQVEAILGESAMIDGQWLTSGSKTGDFTLLGVGTDAVVVADAKGATRSLALTVFPQGLAMMRPSDLARMAGPGGEEDFRGKGKSKGLKKQKGAKARGENDATSGQDGKGEDKMQKLFAKMAQAAGGPIKNEKGISKKIAAMADPEGGSGVKSPNAGPKKFKEPPPKQSKPQSQEPSGNSRNAGPKRPGKKSKSRR